MIIIWTSSLLNSGTKLAAHTADLWHIFTDVAKVYKLPDDSADDEGHSNIDSGHRTHGTAAQFSLHERSHPRAHKPIPLASVSLCPNQRKPLLTSVHNKAKNSNGKHHWSNVHNKVLVLLGKRASEIAHSEQRSSGLACQLCTKGIRLTKSLPALQLFQPAPEAVWCVPKRPSWDSEPRLI